MSAMKSTCLAWPICKQLLRMIVQAHCVLRLECVRWLDKLEQEAGGGGDCSLELWEFLIMQLFRLTITDCPCWCSCGILMKGLGLWQVLNPTCSRPPYGKIDSNFGICAQTQTPMVFSFKWNFIGLTFAEFDEKCPSFLWFCFFSEYWEWVDVNVLLFTLCFHSY